MGIFDIFKKKPKFVDDFFGELSYKSLKETSKKLLCWTSAISR
jgi:hypothetical protein